MKGAASAKWKEPTTIRCFINGRFWPVRGTRAQVRRPGRDPRRSLPSRGEAVGTGLAEVMELKEDGEILSARAWAGSRTWLARRPSTLPTRYRKPSPSSPHDHGCVKPLMLVTAQWPAYILRGVCVS